MKYYEIKVRMSHEVADKVMPIIKRKAVNNERSINKEIVSILKRQK